MAERPFTPPGCEQVPQPLLDVVLDSQITTGRPGNNLHGDTSGLTNRQVRDLAEFLESIDGNTTAAAIPLLLGEAVESGKLKPGMKVALAAFGSGFTWGAAVIDW